jgi:hypothetical protein
MIFDVDELLELGKSNDSTILSKTSKFNNISSDIFEVNDDINLSKSFQNLPNINTQLNRDEISSFQRLSEPAEITRYFSFPVYSSNGKLFYFIDFSSLYL